VKIKIDGQEFPFPEDFTFREMNLIKRLTELRAGQIYDELAKGDSDVIFAFAVIAQKRANPLVDEDSLFDQPIESVELILEPSDEPEDEALPPGEGAAEENAAAA
jgi:hypothetical protein